MDRLEQAHQELDRLQGIISRHESHMFALRGWPLAIIGGLLAAYYAEQIDLSAMLLRVALLLVVGVFLVLESRHVILSRRSSSAPLGWRSRSVTTVTRRRKSPSTTARASVKRASMARSASGRRPE